MNALTWAPLVISSQKSQSIPIVEGFLDTPFFPHPQPQMLPRRGLGIHEVPLNFCFS